MNQLFILLIVFTARCYAERGYATATA